MSFRSPKSAMPHTERAAVSRRLHDALDAISVVGLLEHFQAHRTLSVGKEFMERQLHLCRSRASALRLSSTCTSVACRGLPQARSSNSRAAAS